MYTIIWSDSIGEHYERIETRQSLLKFISEHNLQNDKDCIIFPPSADKLFND